MCFLLFSINALPDYPLVVAGNRDELHNRRARPARFWQRRPDMIAGKDETHGGSWLGLHRNGRFACLTNYRDAIPPSTSAPSRGELVVDYLNGAARADEFADDLTTRLTQFNGFNFVFGTVTSLQHISNRTNPQRQALDNGVHGISNGALNENWPKVRRGRERLHQILQQTKNDMPDTRQILSLLSDQQTAADAQLPDTGVGIARERILAPIFINASEYGTRCSTVITVRSDGYVSFTERSFDANANTSGEVVEHFQLNEV